MSGVKQQTFLQIFFLDASTHLYKRACPSVGPLVRRFNGPSVRRSVGLSRFHKKVKNGQNRLKYENEKYIER